MWKLKGCPRCGGDLFVDWDQHVWYEHCLQCGYRGELKSIADNRKQAVQKGGEFPFSSNAEVN